MNKTLREAGIDVLTFVGTDMRKEIDLEQRLGFSACFLVAERKYGQAQVALHAQGEAKFAIGGIASLIQGITADDGKNPLHDKIPSYILEGLKSTGVDAVKVATLSLFITDILLQLDLKPQEKALLAEAIGQLVGKRINGE